ncbi:MAG TPA: hypothetical protein VD815_10770 [Candidatus Saccharimonadales bacterium]|nr:hypothetical protein [Candidatus Saccharimonadales bacterium]
MDHSTQRNKPDVNLPLLLAGPIIRRVDESSVCIWISTSKNVQAQVKIYRIIGSIDAKKNLIIDNNTQNCGNPAQSVPHNLQAIGIGVNLPLQLGDNLFVNLIVAKPLANYNEHAGHLNDKDSLEFPTNELLAYDLELNSQSEEDKNEVFTLRDLGLLSGKNSILYDSDTQVHHHHRQERSEPYSKTEDKIKSFPSLPMFFVPDRKHNSSLNILYGSCRKLHGDDEDSLIIADKLMQNTFYDINYRPSALFLIGDQIYADGVAGPLIKYLTQFSNKLLGWEESINGVDSKLSDLKIGARQEIVKKYANFSSESAGNHLLSFGEFAAMYLIAWNHINWPERFDSHPRDAFTDSSSLQDYTEELEELEESRRNLFGIRRLLANIPSYMICDDHEITDDWNINKRWCDEVNKSIAGNQIISNGLLAYWAFQAWGNDPESFDQDFITKVKSYLHTKRQKKIEGTIANTITNTSTTSNSILDPSFEGNIVTNSEIVKEFQKVLLRRNWTFVAPTYPLTVFLDCRTQRTFVDKEGPPFLLSDNALEHVKTQLYRHGYQEGNPIIIVSPTPVFGFELAESVQRFLTTISGSYKWDLETWRANEQGFIRFLMYLIKNFKPNYCIFVSGDVHYAFTMKADIDHSKTTSHYVNKGKDVIDSSPQFDYNLPIAQLTSSPFRSNSLRNRIVAILILNLFHTLIISKKKILRYIFRRYENSSTHLNYDYHRSLKVPTEDDDDKKNPSNANLGIGKKSKIHFSKYESGQSVLDKIKIISSNLLTRYLLKSPDKSINLPWVEHRLLVKPKGLCNLPVLPKNNMANVYLDMNSKKVKHTLYYLNKKKDVNHIESSISFK